MKCRVFSSFYYQNPYEYKYWGPTSSNPTADPNPRLEAYVDAARAGATVRILLDSQFDDPGDPRGNTATCLYVNDIAANEVLDLECRIGNPTGSGIHNKMVLVLDGGQGYVHTGSINGSENSSKNNREMAVQVESTDAYNYLDDVFWYDWGTAKSLNYLPLIMRNYPPTPTHTPAPTNTPFPTATNTPWPTNTPIPQTTGNIDITNIFYDGVKGSAEPDEYVQIRNNDASPIQLSGWTLRDVANHVYTFPSHVMQPGQTCRIYTNEYHPEWCGFNYGNGAAIWNNSGDTAYLRDGTGTPIDTYSY